MRKPVAISRARDRFPARRCLLLAVTSAVIFGLSGPADARDKRKPARISAPVVATPVAPARVTTVAAAPASLRAANDGVVSKTMIEAPTGSIRGGLTVGKAPAATTADAVPEMVPSAVPQRQRDWYPESHSYLRPYHYKWRYWTPG